MAIGPSSFVRGDTNQTLEPMKLPEVGLQGPKGGLRGGGVMYVPHSVGGEFAKADAQADATFDEVFSLGKQILKPYMEKASKENFWKGVKDAAAGASMKEIADEHGNVLFGASSYMRGAQMYTVDKALSDYTAHLLKNQDKIRKMSPDEFQKQSIDFVDSLSKFDPDTNSIIQTSAARQFPTLFKQQEKWHYQYAQEEMAKSHFENDMASGKKAIALSRTLAADYANGQGNTQDIENQIAGLTNNIFTKGPGASDETYFNRLENVMGTQMKEGNYAIYSYAKENGYIDKLPVEQQLKLASLAKSHQSDARARFAADNPDIISQASVAIQAADTPEEVAGIAHGLNAYFKAYTGQMDNDPEHAYIDTGQSLKSKKLQLYKGYMKSAQEHQEIMNENDFNLFKLNQMSRILSAKQKLGTPEDPDGSQYQKVVVDTSLRVRQQAEKLGVNPGAMGDSVSMAKKSLSDIESRRKELLDATKDIRQQQAKAQADKDKINHVVSTTLSGLGPVGFYHLNQDQKNVAWSKETMLTYQSLQDMAQKNGQDITDPEVRNKLEIASTIDVMKKNIHFDSGEATPYVNQGLKNQLTQPLMNKNYDINGMQRTLSIYNGLKKSGYGSVVIDKYFSKEQQKEMDALQEQINLQPKDKPMDLQSIWDGVKSGKFDVSTSARRTSASDDLAASIIEDNNPGFIWGGGAAGLTKVEGGSSISHGSNSFAHAKNVISEHIAWLEKQNPGWSPDRISTEANAWFGSHADAIVGNYIFRNSDKIPSVGDVLSKGYDENGFVHPLVFNPEDVSNTFVHIARLTKGASDDISSYTITPIPTKKGVVYHVTFPFSDMRGNESYRSIQITGAEFRKYYYNRIKHQDEMKELRAEQKLKAPRLTTFGVPGY